MLERGIRDSAKARNSRFRCGAKFEISLKREIRDFVEARNSKFRYGTIFEIRTWIEAKASVEPTCASSEHTLILPRKIVPNRAERCWNYTELFRFCV